MRYFYLTLILLVFAFAAGTFVCPNTAADEGLRVEKRIDA